MRGRKTMKTMWVLCEAFTLTGGAFAHDTVHGFLAPWAGVYPSRAKALRALRRYVRERVRENYEGLDDAEADVESAVAEILQNGKCGRYGYSADDREVVWKVYPVKVDVETEQERNETR